MFGYCDTIPEICAVSIGAPRQPDNVTRLFNWKYGNLSERELPICVCGSNATIFTARRFRIAAQSWPLTIFE